MENPEPIKNQTEISTPPISPLRKWAYFAIGFIGWYLVNGLLFLLLGAKLGFSDLTNEALLFVNLIIFPANLIITIILTVMRSTRIIGFGILSALGLNLLISLIMGIFLKGVCFVPFFIK